MDNFKLFLLISVCGGAVILCFLNTPKLFEYVNHIPKYSPHLLSGFKTMDIHVPVKDKIMIMLNTPPWIVENPGMFDECEVSSCHLHTKAAHYVSKSDIVVFYAVGYPSSTSIPQRTKPGQIWVFAVWESPHHSYSQAFDNPVFKNMINWTMTYRFDSDIPTPYGSAKRTTNRQSKNYTKVLAEKTNLVAQLVSHCSTPSQRERYIKSLSSYLPVSIFGQCGRGRINDANIVQTLAKTYKFYLAFENSLCRDYVTEKFFRWQNLSIIPIVRGDANYSHFYPKNSYIDVRDFKSISDLAKYIKYLDKNNTAYIQYLKAKEEYVYNGGLGYTINQSFCQLCKMAHHPENYRNHYSNVQKWYSDGMCKGATDLE